MIKIYVLIFGSVLILMGSFELLFPSRVFQVWKKWISHRLFFLHGASLILLGLPLTCHSGTATGRIIFAVGILIVFTGPFILLYSGRIRRLFLSTTAEMSPAAIKRLIYFDAATRIIVGGLFIANYFL